jgi:hypothetical protein
MAVKFKRSWWGTRVLGLMLLAGFGSAPRANAGPKETAARTGRAASGCAAKNFSPLEPRPARGTRDGGNATGPHECRGNTYAHQEQSAGTGPQLHVIGIRQAKPGADGQKSVQVRVTRPGSSVLVLSAHGQTTWNVQVAPGAQVERILVNGNEEQRVNAPQGVPIEIHDRTQSRKTIGPFGYEWPSLSSDRLVTAAEKLAGRELTSFRGCSEAASFEIGEPGPLKPPNPVSNRQRPTLPKGCEPLAEESTYCMTLNGNTPTVLGLDSGRKCSGVPIQMSDLHDVTSLAWRGDHLYACTRERGLARFSLVDGSVDVAPIGCEAVAAHRDGLLTMLDDMGQEQGFTRALLQFDSFEAATRRESSCAIDNRPHASRMAVQGDQGYFAWHAADEISTLSLARGGEPQTLKLKGYMGWIMGLDVTPDGRLLIIGQGEGPRTPKLLSFERANGNPLKAQTLPFDAKGLACFKGGRLKAR